MPASLRQSNISMTSVAVIRVGTNDAPTAGRGRAALLAEGRRLYLRPTEWAVRPIPSSPDKSYACEAMPTPERGDPLSWFDQDELEVCPSCNEKAVPASESKVAVCLLCEVAWIKDGEPQPLA